MRVSSEDGLLLNTLEDTAERGLDILTYDLSVDPDQVPGWNEAHEDDELVPADNGTYYLPVGKYTLELAMGSANATTSLEIVAPRRFRRR